MKKLIKMLKRWNLKYEVKFDKWQRNAIFLTIVDFSEDLIKYKEVRKKNG